MEDIESIFMSEMEVNPQPKGFHYSSVGKESACNARDLGLIPGLGRSPGEGNGNPLQYSRMENSRLRRPAGYSPWSHKDSNTAE